MTPDEAARSGALLAPATDLGTLEVTGPDRLTWLQGVLTCDVAGLAPGQGRWGLILTRQGKILADVLVVEDGRATYLGLARVAIARVHEYLAGFLIMEDAELADSSARRSWVALHGPKASEVALRVVEALVAVPVASAPIDVTGLGGAALVVSREQEGSARHAALREGAIAATEEDVLRLRVERLVPLYGVDMDEQRSPHDVSLERRSVSWSKGCYLGQEAVCMQDMRGKVKRRLAVVRLAGAELPASGSKVFDGAGVLVGETRSAARSSLSGGPVALAFLSAALAVPGTHLDVAGVSAEVIEPR